MQEPPPPMFGLLPGYVTMPASREQVRFSLERVAWEPITVMNSPPVLTSLAKLFGTAGSGAAFLAYIPHPEVGQIVAYFLIIGGTKIVLGAADGISDGLKIGLRHLVLRMTGAPRDILESEKRSAEQKRTAAQAKADKDGPSASWGSIHKPPN